MNEILLLNEDDIILRNFIIIVGKDISEIKK
jgi:hypothetical protein